MFFIFFVPLHQLKQRRCETLFIIFYLYKNIKLGKSDKRIRIPMLFFIDFSSRYFFQLKLKNLQKFHF